MLITRLMAQIPPKPRCCVLSFDDSQWLFLLVEFIKQQIKEIRSKTQPENLEAKTTPERVWIHPMYSKLV